MSRVGTRGRRPARRQLWCITRPQLEDTNTLLRAACAEREIAWRAVAPDDAVAALRPRIGDLLYVAAAEAAADALAAQLWRAGMVSLQGHGRAPRQPAAEELDAAGLRMPRSVCPAPLDAPAMLVAATALGGFPLLLRLPGGEGGRGVMRVDSPASLVSVREVLPDNATMVEYVPHEIAWRVYVVCSEAVLAEAWRVAPHDFRSNVDGTLEPQAPRSSAVEAAAVSACRLLDIGFAGVDVMVDPQGRPWVAELNTPCWFAGAQARTGVDIAGRLLDGLTAG